MRRGLDGVLLLDKPPGLSSNAALETVKRLLGARKAGHGGTLDPLASGLLPLMFGEATKFARFALEATKAYVALVRLGVETETGDAEGVVLSRRPVRAGDGDIEAALARFRGEIAQVPPTYSALKRDGRPLYALAREGRTVERAPRNVRIDALDLVERTGDELTLRIVCSKGTYVRQIASDLGAALGCGGHLGALRRTAVGHFRIEDAVTLEDLQALGEAGRALWLLPLDRLIEHLPRIELDASQAGRFSQGQVLEVDSAPPGRCRVYRAAGTLLGVGERAAGGHLQPLRLVARG
jgi:tRNA pseudouridine55 synthase